MNCCSLVFGFGPDRATVKITVVLRCGLEAQSASPLPTRAETETWQEALGALEIENLVQKILRQTKSVFICYCVKRWRLRRSLLLAKQQSKYGLCWMVFFFFSN